MNKVSPVPLWLDVRRISRDLRQWFALHARSLPWREHYVPYEVWVSEIMLQQTQMERGVTYFKRWMRAFPDIAALAAASEEEVLRQWEGLGYYSRARNMLAAARVVMDRHGGLFPQDLEAIRALPGVGPYTAAAIASIAFGQRVACVDANVVRVVARLFALEGPVRQEPVAGLLRRLARCLVPHAHAREHNQAMMELGALVCGKRPQCEACPLARHCQARHLGKAHELPELAKKPEVTALAVAVGVVWHKGRVLVRQRPQGGIWPGLWEFPNEAMLADEGAAGAVVRHLVEQAGLKALVREDYGLLRHNYTRYRISLHCLGLTPAEKEPPALPQGWQWVSLSQLEALAMPSPHRKLAGRLGQARQGSLLPATDPSPGPSVDLSGQAGDKGHNRR